MKQEILRILNNRFFETHPFKTGSAGMEGFATILTLAGEMDTQTIADEFLLEINALLKKIKKEGCRSCFPKLCVYAEWLCKDKLPEKSAYYKKLYEDFITHMQNPKHFRKEVEQSLHYYQGLQ